MNQQKLRREGKKWVEDRIISEKQLDQIVERYPKRDATIIILLFAVLLTGLGFITFIFSDWARVPHLSRIILIAIVMVALYILGDTLNRRRSEILGISFITLGYIVFGVGMLLAIDIYQMEFYELWIFILWSIVGLGLYFIYEHMLLFVVSIAVITIGQLYSGSSLSEFSWILFVVFLLGFGYFVYHHRHYLFSYLFAISFSLQMVVLTMADSQEYYWLIVYYFILYLASDLLTDQRLRQPFENVSLASIFIFGMYQTFVLQETYVMEHLEYQMSFIIVWIIMIVFAISVKIKREKQLEMIDFILFIPVAFLPFSYLLSLLVLFVFSLAWLFAGYKQDNQENVLLGTVAFLISTFTVYIQFAWDAMNKSLFFFIGGILLFLISFSIEKQRRRIVDKESGGK